MTASSPTPQLPPSAYEHVRNRVLEARIDKLATNAGRSVTLNTVAVGRPVYSVVVGPYDGSYPAGGYDLDMGLVPLVVTVTGQPYSFGGTTYFPQFDGVDKMLVFSAGVEIAPATDLGQMAGQPITYVGTEDDEFAVHSSQTPETLNGVVVYTSTDQVPSRTDYWSFQLVRRTAAGVRLALGDPVAFIKFGAESGQGTEVGAGTWELETGDSVLVELTSTGNPAALVGCRVFPQIHRRVQ